MREHVLPAGLCRSLELVACQVARILREQFGPSRERITGRVCARLAGNVAQLWADVEVGETGEPGVNAELLPHLVCCPSQLFGIRTRGFGSMGKYSETLTEHVMAPRNGGALENPDLIGHAGRPGRGAFMILYLKVAGDRIAAAEYQTVGCGPAIASGSMLSEMIIGRPIPGVPRVDRRKPYRGARRHAAG